MSQINILLTIGFVLCVSGAFLLRPFFKKPRRQKDTSCFIRHVTEAQRQKLEAAKVPFNYTALDNPDELGILFSSALLKRVLKVLNGTVVLSWSWARDNNVQECLVDWKLDEKSPLNQHKVKVVGKPGCNAERLARLVRNILVPHIRRDIVIYATPGVHRLPPEDGCFHIFLHAAAYDRGQVNHPESLLGLPDLRARNSLAWRSSGFGFPVVDEKTGFVVAELLGNNETRLDVYVDALNLPYPVRYSTAQILSRQVFTSGEDAGLGLLLRILQQVVIDMDVEQYVSEAVAAVSPNGLVSPGHGLPELETKSRNLTGRADRVMVSLTKQILGPAAAKFAKTICVVRCEGRQKEIIDGQVYVFVGAGFIGTRSIESPRRVWGHPIPTAGQTYSPSPYGLPILDNEGQAVGERIGRCIYAYHDLLGCGGRKETLLMARFLSEAARCLAADRDEIGQMLMLQFDGACESVCQETLGVLRNASLPDLQKQVSSTRAVVQQSVVELVRAEREFFRMERSMRDNLGQEFDAIAAITKVVDVKIMQTTLVVTTETLYCTDPRTGIVHDIGAFDIHIPLRSGNYEIRWHNRTRRVRGGNGDMMAPHVNADGRGCLGNTADVFPVLIKQRQFAAVVEAAIAFVESVNVNDQWGKHISNWPNATAERQNG